MSQTVTRILVMLAWAVAAYSVFCLLLFVLQRHLMYPRYVLNVPPEPRLPKGVERIWLETDFGKVESWLFSPRAETSEPAPAMIVAHGNAELIDYFPEEFRPMTDNGMAVLLVEYPGYGRSAGSPSQERIGETFRAAFDRLAERDDVDAGRIVFFGRSLGGGAVCALSGDRPPAAMILVSTFTSARAFSSRYFAPGFLVRDPFDNLAAVRNYAGPVLIVHGKSDEVIPFRHGVALGDAASNGRMLILDCGHNDCPNDPDEYWRTITKFLADAGVLRKQSPSRRNESGTGASNGLKSPS